MSKTKKLDVILAEIQKLGREMKTIAKQQAQLAAQFRKAKPAKSRAEAKKPDSKPEVAPKKPVRPSASRPALGDAQAAPVSARTQ